MGKILSKINIQTLLRKINDMSQNVGYNVLVCKKDNILPVI